MLLRVMVGFDFGVVWVVEVKGIVDVEGEEGPVIYISL